MHSPVGSRAESPRNGFIDAGGCPGEGKGFQQQGLGPGALKERGSSEYRGRGLTDGGREKITGSRSPGSGSLLMEVEGSTFMSVGGTQQGWDEAAAQC